MEQCWRSSLCPCDDSRAEKQLSAWRRKRGATSAKLKYGPFLMFCFLLCHFFERRMVCIATSALPRLILPLRAHFVTDFRPSQARVDPQVIYLQSLSDVEVEPEAVKVTPPSKPVRRPSARRQPQGSAFIAARSVRSSIIPAETSLDERVVGLLTDLEDSLGCNAMKRLRGSALPPTSPKKWQPHGIATLGPSVYSSIVGSVPSSRRASPKPSEGKSSLETAPVDLWSPSFQESDSKQLSFPVCSPS